MEEIILSRAEFLVLLDAMKASAVVGIDSQELFPASIDEHRRLVEQGQRMLQERGLLDVAPNDVRVLDPLLIAIAAVVARPEIAIISVRDTPEIGRQLFLHYQAGEYVVEQTFPAEGQHRLATLPDLAALFDRLLAIFPVQDTPTPESECVLSQEEFLAAKEHAEAGRDAEAIAILTRPGFGAEEAAAFVEAMAEPVFSGTIALLRCAEEEVIEARNPAIVQGRRAAWSIAQAVPGAPRFRVTKVDAARLRDQLVGWLNELRDMPHNG
jgi:hypothetical protein